MKLWLGTVAAFGGAIASLVYWIASGGGDCAECPHTWDQELSKALSGTLYGATLLLLLACLAVRRRGERVLAAGLFVLVGLLGFAFLWIITAN